MSQVQVKQHRERKRIIALMLIIVALFFCAFGGFGRRSSNIAQADTQNRVYLGGTPVGLKLSSEGLTVVGFVPIITDAGSKNPSEEAGLKIGDMLLKADGKELKSPSDVARAIKSTDKPVKFTVKRGGELSEFTVTPLFDPLSGENKIGIIVKNEIAGVGTLTFTATDGRFCTLGHQISDPDVGDQANYGEGFVYACNVLGVVKSVKGEAGALKGVFDRNSAPIGKVSVNNVYGVYGSAIGSALKSGALVDIGKISDVKPGKAHIYSTIEGDMPKRYDIEIVKAVPQKVRDTKGLFIRVTDKNLLKITGGIVQGMSGSPIVQNGKLVGAVTHVMVEDPVYGYGIYAEWLTE